MKPPEQCRDMTDLRAAIDELDARIVALLARRADYIDRASAIKLDVDLPARIPARVEEVVSHVRSRADEEGLDPDLAERLWRELIDWSIAREARILGSAEESGR